MSKKRWVLLRFILTMLIATLVLVVTMFAMYNEPLPKGTQGAEAEALAKKMLHALNYDMYKNTHYLEWSFRNGKHNYKWNKKLGHVQVRWNDYSVKLVLHKTLQSEVFKNNVKLLGPEKTAVVEIAKKKFNNDSFWLLAPYKLYDPGVTRGVVELSDGSKALLVTYLQGGTTPGDAYLWKLQPNGFPISFQMWVKKLPVGGLEASWDDWLIAESGMFLPKSHKIGPIKLDMGELRGYNDQYGGLEQND